MSYCSTQLRFIFNVAPILTARLHTCNPLSISYHHMPTSNESTQCQAFYYVAETLMECFSLSTQTLTALPASVLVIISAVFLMFFLWNRVPTTLINTLEE